MLSEHAAAYLGKNSSVTLNDKELREVLDRN